jgi:hypothetical protein
MRRPTIEEKLATYSMFQVRQGSTVPITAREWLDSLPPPPPPSPSQSGANSSTFLPAAAGSACEAPARKKRTPGRWRRIPRTLPHPCLRKRPMTWEELLADSLDMSDEAHCFREEDKPAFRESKAQMARFYQRMIDIEKNKIEQIFRPRVLSDTPYVKPLLLSSSSSSSSSSSCFFFAHGYVNYITKKTSYK